MLEAVYGDVYSSWTNYGTAALAIAALAFSGFYGLIRKNLFRCIYMAVLTGYTYVLFSLTLFSRAAGQFSDVNLKMFRISPVFPYYSLIQYTENFLLFLPLGFLLPLGFRFFRRAFPGLMTGFLVSAGIEYLQYRTARGIFDLDDIIMNGLGAAGGYILWILCAALLYPVILLKRGIFGREKSGEAGSGGKRSRGRS